MSLRGGKVLAEGGQGCIIDPTWSTRVSKNHRGRYITKIMSKSSSENEYAISNFLRRKDPEGHYGIYNEGPRECNGVTLEKLAKEGVHVTHGGTYEHAKCSEIAHNILRGTSKEYCTITIPKFKQDLEDPVNLAYNGLKMGILNLWTAMAFLHDNNVVHSDIKMNNLAFSDKTFKFFDWGWASKVTTAKNTDEQYDRMTSARSYVWPNGPWAPNLESSRPVSWREKRLAMKFNDVFGLARCTLKIMSRNGFEHTKLKQLMEELEAEGKTDTRHYRPASMIAHAVNELFMMYTGRKIKSA